MGDQFLFQGIFLTPGSNPCLQVSCIAGRYFITKPLRKPDCMFCLFCSVAKSSLTLCDRTDYMGSSGKNTRVGCHFLLQRIFLDQGSNPCLFTTEPYSLPLSPQGSPIYVYPHFIVTFSFHFPDQVSLRVFIK